VQDAERVSETEAEEEAARAEARAEEARAHAMRLRRQVEAASEISPESDYPAGQNDKARRPRRLAISWRPKLRLPGRKALGVTAAVALICASLMASAYMLWQHHVITQKRQQAAEFAAAARQAVVTLMSIDADHARDDLQRVIDISTGQLKAQVEATSSLLAKRAEESKVSTKATVEVVAVESMTDDSAVVLVAAKSDTKNPDKTKRPPASWRLSVDIARDGGQLKMSKVEFI
jgi:Mce-associated membrane protein